MTVVTLYTFEDEGGSEDGYMTFSAHEARERAHSQGLRCFANEYEYSDREVAWDFTPETPAASG